MLLWVAESFHTINSANLAMHKSHYNKLKSIRTFPRLKSLQLSENKLFADPENFVDYKSDLKKFLGWFGATMGFAALVSNMKGTSSAIEFLSGYFLEETLSIDNLFVFLLLFKFFSIEKKNEEVILAYGLYGGNCRLYKLEF